MARQLGDLEAAVMDRLWTWQRPAAVREVLDDLAVDRKLAYTTVMTVMDNLHRKGLLTRTQNGRAYIYSPARSRTEHTADLIASVLATSDDRAAPLMRFAEQMDYDELTRLRASLEELESARPGAGRLGPAHPVTESLALLLYAAGAGTAGAALLRRAGWTGRAPALGVAAWQVLSGSILAALLLAGLVVVVPAGVASNSLAEFLHACVMSLRSQYATPGGAAAHAGGVLLTAILAVRTAYLFARGLRDARWARAEHLRGLRLVARRDAGLDALVVDHPAAAAYCLPGRAATVVLTSSALDALSARELAAVLAHERAHLRGRHHLVTAAAAALASALPFVPGLRWACTEQSRLLEMIADDAAARHGDRLCVARALVSLAGNSVPAAALSTGDTAAVARVERLIHPAPRLGPVGRLGVGAAIALTALTPVAIAAAPAVAAAQTQYCPVTSTAPMA